MSELTKAQTNALKWLTDRGGDGLFDLNGVAMSQGDLAPVERKTWNALRKAGLIEFYNPRADGKGRGRLRIVKP